MLLNFGEICFIVLMIFLGLFVLSNIGMLLIFVSWLNRVVFFFIIGMFVIELIFLRLRIVVLFVIIVIELLIVV